MSFFFYSSPRFQATSPSPFLEMPDSNDSHYIEGVLYHLGSQIGDAQLAVELYMDASSHMRTATKKAYTERRNDIKNDQSSDESWQAQRASQMHARSLIFAIDNFEKMLNELAKEAPEPLRSSATREFKRLEQMLPGVKETRNSLHHIEDRIRRKAFNKDIVPEPISKPGFVEAKSGAMLVGSNMLGNNISNTDANGELQGVEVSLNTVEQMVSSLQSIINDLPWKNFPNSSAHIKYPNS